MLTLIKNARVFAPDELGVCHVLVAGGTIAAVSRDPIDVSGSLVREIDADGLTLIPGLLDGHAHFTGGGGEDGFKTRVPPVPLSHFTAAGITTALGVLGTDDTTRDTRALLAQTLALRDEGFNAWCYTGGYHLPAVTLTGSVRDDIVFLDPVVGVGELAISDHRSSQPTLEELLRIASDAHVAGLIARKAGILHLHLGDGDRGLDLVRRALETAELPARVFNPTHINRRKALFDESLALAHAGCTVDITAFPVEDGEDAWAADVALGKYLDSGAPANRITVSSDGGGCLPVFDKEGKMLSMGIGSPASLMHTIQKLVNAGRSLADILPAFTSNVANLLRMPERGRISAGAAADLVLLDDDASIDSVMLSGVWHVQGGRQVLRGQFELEPQPGTNNNQNRPDQK